MDRRPVRTSVRSLGDSDPCRQIHIGDVLVLQGHGAAAFQHQHGFALAAQGAGQGAATGAAADDDHVVMAVVDDHGITARRR